MNLLKLPIPLPIGKEFNETLKQGRAGALGVRLKLGTSFAQIRRIIRFSIRQMKNRHCRYVISL